MNTQELRAHLDRWSSALKTEDRRLLHARLKSLVSVFPFNEYEYILTFLVDRGVISFGQYERLRRNYVSSNRYLDLFGLAPRIFGQVWGEKHLMDLDARFRKPNLSLDPHYAGQYDLWCEGARIEVKAARAINTKKRGALVSKALHFDATEPFWMNFQQLKFEACDAFVFIGVWVDQLLYWVLTSAEAQANRYQSHQHRGGIEYQIGITRDNLAEFEIYRVAGAEVADTIIRKTR